MASLFRQGLIYGFNEGRWNIEDVPAARPLAAKRHMALDFKDAGAEERYRRFYKTRLGNENGAIPLAFLRENLDALRDPWWVEFVGCSDADPEFRVALLGVVVETMSGLSVHSTLWTDLPNKSVASSLASVFALDFSDDGFLLNKPSTAAVIPVPSMTGWRNDMEGSSFLTTLDSMLAICGLNQGWFHTERGDKNEFSLTEAKKAKAAPRYIERKKALMALDVREVRAFIEPPVPDWVEIDPLADKARPRHHSGVREHEVRPFTRFYKKSGKTVSVRAHRRGNPDLGSLVRVTRLDV